LLTCSQGTGIRWVLVARGGFWHVATKGAHDDDYQNDSGAYRDLESEQMVGLHLNLLKNL
jgi:hypothetical protein